MSMPLPPLALSLLLLLAPGCSGGGGGTPPSFEMEADRGAPEPEGQADASAPPPVDRSDAASEGAGGPAPEGTLSVAELLANATSHIDSVIQVQGPIHSMGADWAAIGTDDSLLYLKLGPEVAPLNQGVGSRIMVEGTFEEAMSLDGEGAQYTIQRVRVSRLSAL